MLVRQCGVYHNSMWQQSLCGPLNMHRKVVNMITASSQMSANKLKATCKALTQLQ